MKGSDNPFPKLVLTETVTPSAPAAGLKRLYAKVAGLFYLNSAGVETRIATQLEVQQDTTKSAVAAGTADAITATITPAPTMVDQMTVYIRASGPNTITNPTFNLNGTGAIGIFKNGGSALAVGDIVTAGHELNLRYRASVPRWELLNPGAASVGGGGGGGATFPYSAEPFPFRGVWGRVQYVPNATTTTLIGVNTALVTVLGTFSAVNRAGTNSYTRQPRGAFASAAGAGSGAGFYNNTNVFSGDGGWHFSTRFGVADAAAVANARQFYGVRNAVAAPTNANPSSWTDIFGIGSDSGDANLQLMTNDAAGVATKTDLGANFPANSLSTDFYEVQFERQPAAALISWKIRNVRTGNVSSGTVGADISASATELGPIIWRQNGATALAVKVEISGWLIAYTLEG